METKDRGLVEASFLGLLKGYQDGSPSTVDGEMVAVRLLDEQLIRSLHFSWVRRAGYKK